MPGWAGSDLRGRPRPCGHQVSSSFCILELIMFGYTGLINCFVTIDELVYLFQILADFDFSGCYLCIINANTQYSNNCTSVNTLKCSTPAIGTYEAKFEAEYFLPKSSFHCFQTARTWLRWNMWSVVSRNPSGLSQNLSWELSTIHISRFHR